ncbi:hypothetical protein DFJ58DRAFT_723571 [Suillus subalutaceus]|uniref:uncharacterized protein n=1 Tax=Suillus subalutaceus TaxID=48586 RepID=UPI001B86658A|nr:uncharacterized protein DFJ58DRAFT_723571 [Suillus subalutaceus]KAG1868315.1 hypothetical protein DFJ58DRAFT_723571 [Suillus subalutaceus]
MSNSSKYDLTKFTILDATNILEYATSRFATIWIACDRSHVPWSPAYIASFVWHLQWEADSSVFPYINICMVLNTHPTMTDLLRSIISRFTCLQTRNITSEQFYAEFFVHCSPHDPELRSTHRVVLKYAHDWWKDRFDTLGFTLPSLDVNEVLDMMADHFEQLPMGAMLLPGPAVAGQVEGDPLLNQILAVKARVQHLGNSLERMLQEKTMKAAAAATTMSELEGPMDQLEEALLTSRRP